jgi:hypothetical protein
LHAEAPPIEASAVELVRELRDEAAQPEQTALPPTPNEAPIPPSPSRAAAQRTLAQNEHALNDRAGALRQALLLAVPEPPRPHSQPAGCTAR